MKQLTALGRLIFGAWMLADGVNYFFLPLWSMPTGHEPLAVQLMASLQHSGLFGVAMAIQLVTGALILAGLLVPVALCVVMPVSTCAVFWAVILDHQALEAVLALAGFALNGLLMLAYIDYFRGALQPHALMLGESSGESSSFDFLFVNPNGRTSRGQFAGALITLIAVLVFYAFRVTGLTAHWCMFMLLFPAVVLHARRLHDLGHSAWLLFAPTLLAVAAFAIWLRLVSFGPPYDAVVPLATLAIFVVFALWGCVAGGQPEANRYGMAVTA
ncbi:MAG: DUF805 domain-containing protein [Steroidobacteraceae bacterium]